jgi:hypothetical protein
VILALRKRVFPSLIVFFLLLPLGAHAVQCCVDFCYCENSDVVLSNIDFGWVGQMGYYQLDEDEKYTWDCNPETACTSECSICERDEFYYKLPGDLDPTLINYTAGSDTAGSCSSGNQASYHVTSQMTFAFCDYYIYHMVSCATATSPCPQDVGEMRVASIDHFRTGAVPP